VKWWIIVERARSSFGTRRGAVAAYLQQFEKEQEERRKAQNLKAAQRRKECAQPLPNRTSLLGTKADIST
jgi:hypothetical protein